MKLARYSKYAGGYLTNNYADGLGVARRYAVYGGEYLA